VNSELLAAIATVAFKSLSASEVLSNPFRLYVYAFDWASNRSWWGAMRRARFYASFHLIEQPMDAF
jgi:hypothetical protein